MEQGARRKESDKTALNLRCILQLATRHKPLVTRSGGRMRSITRRSFLITGAAAVGSCFVPSWLLRRASDFAQTDGGIYIDAPDSARNTLYAVDQGYHFQFALNGRTDEWPPQFTWR